jgi:hypothetical protein
VESDLSALRMGLLDTKKNVEQISLMSEAMERRNNEMNEKIFNVSEETNKKHHDLGEYVGQNFTKFARVIVNFESDAEFIRNFSIFLKSYLSVRTSNSFRLLHDFLSSQVADWMILDRFGDTLIGGEGKKADVVMIQRTNSINVWIWKLHLRSFLHRFLEMALPEEGGGHQASSSSWMSALVELICE